MTTATLRPFLVELKRGKLVQDRFEVYGTDSMAVADAHHCLAYPGQYIKVTPLSAEADLEARERRELHRAIQDEAQCALMGGAA